MKKVMRKGFYSMQQQCCNFIDKITEQNENETEQNIKLNKIVHAERMNGISRG